MNLNTDEIRSICIKRLSGMTQIEIGKQYGISRKQAKAVQDKEPEIMSIFVKNADGVYILNPKYSQLWIDGDFITPTNDLLEITGDENDGVVYANEIWSNYGYTDPNYDFSLNESDLGIYNQKLKIGKIIVLDSYSAKQHNLKPASKSIAKRFINKFNGSENNYILIDRVVDKSKSVVEQPVKVEEPTEIPLLPVVNEFVWSASNKFISITLGRESWNADSSHPKFKEALQHLINSEYQQAVDLIVIEKAITEFVDGKIEIKDGVLKYENYVLTNGLTKRIIDRMQAGEDFKFFIPFLNNLMENPSEKAVNRLFDFLEANDIEITEDGHFLTYKKVRHDYRDLRTGDYDNTPNGDNPPRMNRNQVDEDDSVTCSRGLHVCSKSYLNSYGSSTGTDRIVLCKVHPRDVVAIPYDYNNAKMRTCGYIVIEDVTDKFKAQ